MDSIDGIDWFELLVQICELQHWTYEIGNVNHDRTYIRISYRGELLGIESWMITLYAGLSNTIAEHTGMSITQFLARDLLTNAIFDQQIKTLESKKTFPIIRHGTTIEEIKLKLAIEDQRTHSCTKRN